MTKRRKTSPAVQPDAEPESLKGWQQIAAFLGQPISVVQRWAKTGMPVRRQGRYVTVTPADLNQWLGKESGEPLRVATEQTDLSSELKRGLAYVRSAKHQRPSAARKKRR